jgi:5-methylthioadenosine/S-adenosylhomocysteine deaminase
MTSLLIENVDYLLAVDAQDSVLEHASIVVENGRITGIGSASEVAARSQGKKFDKTIDGSNTMLMPGLVDAHVHLSEAYSRGLFPDNLSTRPWVFNWAKPFYSAVDEEAERWSVQLACLELIKSGTTCFLDMGSQNDVGITVREAGRSGLRGITGRHAADVKPTQIPPGWKKEMVDHHFFKDADEALAALEACVVQWDKYASGRIRCWVNIEGKEPCSPALHKGSRELAERLGVGTTYHISSSIEEAEVSKRRYGVWPVTRLAQMDALGPNLVLAHVVAATKEEIKLLAEHGTKVAFCPGTSLKIAKGATKIGMYPEMLDAGVTVALGCDGVSAAGALDMTRQLYLAAGLFKDCRMNAEMVPAARAIRMATIDGAAALMWDKEIGSVEVGKRADLIMFDLNQIEWVPCHDPVQTLVYSATGSSVKNSIIDGEVVMESRKVLTLNEDEIVRQARRLSPVVTSRSGLKRGTTPVTTVLYD